jgi:hypothetical protein
MTCQEAAKTLLGPYQPQKDLFDSYLARLVNGEALLDWELAILEALKAAVVNDPGVP